ncbi:MAG: branched-chain amino acid ABC transporter substrate-binding protein [Chloroflexi bacterium]|nr:branched-chain amino acid ABC transporter substrate-binding protein [Chloroflexota bacterium]
MSACAGVGTVSAPPTIKIGLVAPFEGLHRPLGYEALFGVKLALQERNAAEGVGGYRVELVALNDFDDPVEAPRQARALIADPDILGVVGHLSAATTQTAAPIYQEANMAMVVPWSAADLESDRGGVVSVAANLAETSARLEAAGREMGFEHVTPLVDGHFEAISGDTQALLLDTEGVTAGETLLALRQANISLPVLGQVDTGSPQTLQVTQTAANGLIFVSPGPDPQQLDEAASFIAAYRALAGFSPGPRAVLAYDATHVLLGAIEQSLGDNHPPTRAKVSAVIGTVQWQGLSGEIVFDQQGGRRNAPVWIYQIASGAYPGVLLSP